jgi:hypothetical protein
MLEIAAGVPNAQPLSAPIAPSKPAATHARAVTVKKRASERGTRMFGIAPVGRARPAMGATGSDERVMLEASFSSSS